MSVSNLRLIFTATECNGWPKIKILINNDLYEDYHFTTDHAEIIIPLTFLTGDHILSIEIYGKSYNNTIVNDTGDIIKDQMIELVDLCADNIKLPKMFAWQGIYTFNNQKHHQSLVWGCNGIWEWGFSMPFVTWVLDKKEEFEEAANPSTESHINITNEIIRRYNILRTLLDEIND